MTKPILAQETPFGRRYVHPKTGEMVPSVTTILNSIPKDLASWAAKQAAQYVIDEWENLVYYMVSNQQAKAFQLISSAHERTRDKASIRGDEVHESAEGFTKGTDDGKSPDHMKQLKRFFEVSRFQPIYPEVTLWNRAEGYAGTADLIAKDRNGSFVLIDYKTGKGIWPEMAVQIEALSRCDFIITPEGEEKPIPQIKTVGVLHLRPRSFWWHPIQDQAARDRNWGVFLRSVDIHKIMEGIQEWKHFHPDMVWGKLGRFNEANWPQAKAA
jgi:hypothetical protein